MELNLGRLKKKKENNVIQLREHIFLNLLKVFFHYVLTCSVKCFICPVAHIDVFTSKYFRMQWISTKGNST